MTTSISDVGGATAQATSSARISPAGQPPPPPGSRPIALTAPRIVSLPGHPGTYRCKPGTWAGIAPGTESSAFSYTWLLHDRGRIREVAHTATYRPARTSDAPRLAAGSFYECLVSAVNPSGTASKLSRAVLLTPVLGPILLKPAYGDVRIRGIDVFQEVQPSSGAQQFLFPTGAFAALPGGGTPTNLRFAGFGGLVGERQRADYQGVLLDRTKPATAVVYVDMKGSAATDPKQPLQVSLTLSYGNRVLGPITTTAERNPPAGASDVVSATERASSRYSLRFRLPTDWLVGVGYFSDTQATFSLRAHVGFPPSSDVFGARECDATGCEANDTYRLDGITVGRLPVHHLTIETLDLRRAGQSAPPSGDSLLRSARRVMPGGEWMRVLPYAAQLDITASTNAVPAPGNFCRNVTVRSCRQALVGAQVDFWGLLNPGLIRLRGIGLPDTVIGHVYDLLMGVHNYSTGTGSTEPGWSSPTNNIANLPLTSVIQSPSYLAVTSTGRPLTAVAHELGHELTAPHADIGSGPVGSPPDFTGPHPDGTPDCGGGSKGQIGEPWAPDNEGHLQGALANFQTVFGADPTVVRSVSVDGVGGKQLFDLMSYCAPTNPESGVGVSARNWSRFFSAQLAYAQRLAALGLAESSAVRPAVRRAAAAARPAALAVGLVSAGGGAITRIGRAPLAPVPVASSSLRLRSLAADGRVLREDGVALQPLADGGRVADFAGPVDAAAAAVELVRDGTVLDRRQRSQAPRVRLLGPSPRVHLRRGHRLAVRWRASDVDSRGLDARVDFSPDGGRSWRTVLDGPSRGSARVPSSYLVGSRDARVRVTISDGFAEARADSGRFRVDPRPPLVTIERPLRGEFLRAGRAVLLGDGRDDIGRTLGGRALTWFAGHRRLGHGARLRTRGLAAGRMTLRLVARSASGVTASARLRVRVLADPPRLTLLRGPGLVGVRARSVVIRVRSAARAVLRTGGHRYAIGPRTRRVRLALPRAPRRGLLRLGFVLSGPGGRTGGALEVVRA